VRGGIRSLLVRYPRRSVMIHFVSTFVRYDRDDFLERFRGVGLLLPLNGSNGPNAPISDFIASRQAGVGRIPALRCAFLPD